MYFSRYATKWHKSCFSLQWCHSRPRVGLISSVCFCFRVWLHRWVCEHQRVVCLPHSRQEINWPLISGHPAKEKTTVLLKCAKALQVVESEACQYVVKVVGIITFGLWLEELSVLAQPMLLFVFVSNSVTEATPCRGCVHCVHYRRRAKSRNNGEMFPIWPGIKSERSWKWKKWR